MLVLPILVNLNGIISCYEDKAVRGTQLEGKFKFDYPNKQHNE